MWERGVITCNLCKATIPTFYSCCEGSLKVWECGVITCKTLLFLLFIFAVQEV